MLPNRRKAREIGFAIRLTPSSQQVDRQAPLAERLQCQFTHESAHALHLYTVVENQQKHPYRHAKCGIRVSGRHNPEKWDAKFVHQQGNVVYRQQVHQVHRKNPKEDGQRQGRNHFVLAGK